MDQNVNCFRIGIRGKKYYWCLITWLVDVSIQNAWLLYHKSFDQSSHLLDFKRQIVLSLCKKYGKPSLGAGRPKTKVMSKLSSDVGFDGENHFLIPSGKRNRCAFCTGVPNSKCSKCDVGLCLKCNMPWHTK